jgi:chromosome segregation ATPase
MARIAVTFEQVAAVANALYAQGIKDPGTKAIREELATRAGPGGTVGSPNTVQAHLNRWRAENRPMDAVEVPQLPAQLAADISRALTAAASVAQEKVEERLAQVQAELNELVTVGEASEARIEELMQELAARTSERDSMAGQLAERTAEVAELKTALTIATDKAATLERELHAAQAEAQAANGRVDEIRQATERQITKMQSDLDQARAGQADAQHHGSEADKRAVATEARLDGERAAKVALEARMVELKESLKRLEGDASRAAAAEAAATGLRDQVTLLNETVAMLRSLLEASGKAAPPGSEAARSKGSK